MNTWLLGANAMSVVPQKPLKLPATERHGDGCPPTSISISILPVGENSYTTDVAASVVHTLPSESMRIACGIVYIPFPHDRTTCPSRSSTTIGSALSPR